MAWNHLGVVIAILALLWVMWYAAIRPENPNPEDPFLKPPAPLDTGETYGPTYTK